MTEELVEEIGRLIYDAVSSIMSADIPGELGETKSYYAKKIISRILKAVEDGELDEALGVAGGGEGGEMNTIGDLPIDPPEPKCCKDCAKAHPIWRICLQTLEKVNPYREICEWFEEIDWPISKEEAP